MRLLPRRRQTARTPGSPPPALLRALLAGLAAGLLAAGPMTPAATPAAASPGGPEPADCRGEARDDDFDDGAIGAAWEEVPGGVAEYTETGGAMRIRGDYREGDDKGTFLALRCDYADYLVAFDAGNDHPPDEELNPRLAGFAVRFAGRDDFVGFQAYTTIAPHLYKWRGGEDRRADLVVLEQAPGGWADGAYQVEAEGAVYTVTLDDAVVLRFRDPAADFLGTRIALRFQAGALDLHHELWWDDFRAYGHPDPPCPRNAGPWGAGPIAADGLGAGLAGWTGHAYTFRAGPASDPDGDPLRFTWTWADGSPGGEGREAEHAYATAGARVVELRVVDDPSWRDVPGCPPLVPRSNTARALLLALDDLPVGLTSPAQGTSCLDRVMVRTEPAPPAIAGGCAIVASVPPLTAALTERVRILLDGTTWHDDPAPPYARDFSSLEASAGFHRFLPCATARNDKYGLEFCGLPHDFVNAGPPAA